MTWPRSRPTLSSGDHTDSSDGERVARPASQQVVEDALRILETLDNTPPSAMSALWYMEVCGELEFAVRDLLRIMGEDVPD